MSEDQASLNNTWNQVVTELTRQAADKNSVTPALTARQRAFLSLVQPVEIVPGFALITTPHEMAKTVIEEELGQALTAVLSEKLGTPCHLAVTVDSNQPPRQPSRQPAPQTTPETAPTKPGPKLPLNTATAAPTPTPPATTPATATPSTANNASTDQGEKSATAETKPGWAATLAAASANGKNGPDLFHQDPSLKQPVRSGTSGGGNGTGNRNMGGAAQGRGENNGDGSDISIAIPVDKQKNLSPSQTQFQRRIPREAPAHDPNRETSLNPKYTFDSFVIGSSNRFANGAAVAVAENPARAYNPLFIAGGSGLGKTHLLHAAGNYAKVLQPSLRIKYVSSEEFTNDYINSVRDDRQESFKRRYRNLDILMVDDIQFLQGKEGTQEEFFHTFNALHQANKQIILSSDRPPKELTTLEDRLRTRFQAGLIADIQPPDLETRIAILMKKAESDGTLVDRDVLELIASSFESSIRELEGALIRVSAYSSLTNAPIDMAMAEAALRDILPNIDEVEVTTEKILAATSEFFDISVETLIGPGKVRAVAHARQLAMYLCRELTDLSLPAIGADFGDRDHSTVIYAVRKIAKEIKEQRDTYDAIQQLTQQIKARSR
ncbi:chromosomal replication initiator protein DnaA [Corynebacterium caspium]|uniref:chromosomal replication initiator protein DnaA n=1 Tax=Corynebacterium caspium TaxID=234828 RepID=UPI0003812F9B|nr:chromosomal replication initiator protein DnaA [Corynebacterium caspium]WKD58440.1 Chromosomal replication initiator protein DnaA [Corynebacterium caspium DSM 44850]